MSLVIKTGETDNFFASEKSKDFSLSVTCDLTLL
jgi:hypothetical protein